MWWQLMELLLSLLLWCLGSGSVSCLFWWIEADMSYYYGLCLIISVSPRCALFITALRKLWNISHIKSLSMDSITTLFSCSRNWNCRITFLGRNSSLPCSLLVVQSAGKVLLQIIKTGMIPGDPLVYLPIFALHIWGIEIQGVEVASSKS